jgi:hypothetical protein
MDVTAAGALLTRAEEASSAARGADAKAALDGIESEYVELVAALQWFTDNERTDNALRLASVPPDGRCPRSSRSTPRSASAPRTR